VSLKEAVVSGVLGDMGHSLEAVESAAGLVLPALEGVECLDHALGGFDTAIFLACTHVAIVSDSLRSLIISFTIDVVRLLSVDGIKVVLVMVLVVALNVPVSCGFVRFKGGNANLLEALEFALAGLLNAALHVEGLSEAASEGGVAAL